jgi:hypothetical protein
MRNFSQIKNVVFPVFFLVGGVYLSERKKSNGGKTVFMSGLTRLSFVNSGVMHHVEDDNKHYKIKWQTEPQ